MDHHIGMYVLGILSILGGFELIRYSWPDTQYEQDCGTGFAHSDHGFDFQPAHLGVTFGAILMVFGVLACYGGYCGWTMMKVLTMVKDLAQEYII